MTPRFTRRRFPVRLAAALLGVTGSLATAGCASSGGAPMAQASVDAPSVMAEPMSRAAAAAPSPDPRVGLAAGLLDAGEATWNMRVVSATPPPEAFVGMTNSDLAFTGKYAIQGNYNGYQIWDISNPAAPTLAEGFVCPASQSDVSVYKNLLFVSGEGLGGRLDCGTEGVQTAVSHDRLRGLRIFDISDIHNPKYVGNVQTCRGSHTHSVLVDPKDHDNVYVYISGSSSVRPAAELPGCSGASPSEDPNSALFRIEVIRVPLAHPEHAAIVSSPRIFNDLVAPPSHGLSQADRQAIEDARAQGAFVAEIRGVPRVLPSRMVQPYLEDLVKQRGGAGAPTAADSAKLREMIPRLIAERFPARAAQDGPAPGPTQCHDITLDPSLGLAGGACEGYGMLLDIRDPVNPVRLAAVADSNFSYWHSATFNNDGTKVLFSDEWGGGGQPKCRATDPKHWGADAIFSIEGGQLYFKSYYKMSAPQTSQENCVAHNGSLIPIPGRDVMVQSWYQGGLSVFDWTDASNPTEIAYFDRGPVSAERMAMGGSWSAYWYNGVIVSSEIARGLDIVELTPSPFLTQNEIDAARSVKLDYLNTQGQPHFQWPATFALAGAYVDQLERSRGLSSSRITEVRRNLAAAEAASGSARRKALTSLASDLDTEARGSSDGAKVKLLADAVRKLSQQ